MTHTKFTSTERDLLAGYLASGTTKSECARLLGRPRRSVIREITHNGCWTKAISGRRVFVYSALAAQGKVARRQQHSAQNKHPLKNEDVFSYVTRKLRRGWSPEQIAGRLKTDHPHDPRWHICHETIYVWIFEQQDKDCERGLFWYEYLRRKQTKRKKQHGRTVHRSHIPDRVSISKRPAVINNRRQFGHWEGDSIEGSRKNNPGVHTEVERMSRKIKAVKVTRIASIETIAAQRTIFCRLPRQARRSTTLDNGTETHRHYQLRNWFGMKTYHAHPYASFERGTNEHGNWHLRYYFPKGTDFSTVSDKELHAVVEEINNRPRKILNFQTANEIYSRLLKQARCDDPK